MPLLPRLAAVLAVAVWSVLPLLIKHTAFDANIALFLLLRFTMSTLLLSPVLPALWRKLPALSPMLWLGFLLLNAMNYFVQTLALQLLPATLYIVAFALTPILCLLALRIRLRLQAWLWTAVTLLACLWFVLAGGPTHHGELSVTAMLAMLGSMLSWALYSAYIQHFQALFRDVEIAGLGSVFGLLAALPVWLAGGLSLAGASAPGVAGAVLIGAIVPLGYAAYSYALRTAPVFAVTSQYLEPVLALLLVVALTTETLSQQQGLAALLCFSAAMLADRAGRQHATA